MRNDKRPYYPGSVMALRIRVPFPSARTVCLLRQARTRGSRSTSLRQPDKPSLCSDRAFPGLREHAEALVIQRGLAAQASKVSPASMESGVHPQVIQAQVPQEQRSELPSRTFPLETMQTPVL